ncbi:MAG: short-chain fatty acyl-CoA regulator family protein [Pseudomonadota bacterium]
MDENSHLGGKIRALRRRQGVTQAELAKQLGISSSYLNLIEHERRALPAPLLIKMAGHFQLDIAQLAAGHDVQLTQGLLEVFGDPLFENLELASSEIKDMVAAAPNLSHAVVRLFRSYCEHRETGDHLAHRVAEALSSPGTSPAGLPTEEVPVFIQQHRHHFAELEDAAEALWREAKLHPSSLLEGLLHHLEEQLGVRVHVIPSAEDGGALARFVANDRQLLLSESLPRSHRCFQLAHRIARITQGALMQRLVEDPALTTEASRDLGREVLASYFAGAVLMPYQAFLDAARSRRHDLELLQNVFDASFEMVCDRLTTLQRPGQEGIPFHLARGDLAGNLSKWFSASGRALTRHGAACPRWSLHRAFLTPGRFCVQLSRAESGQVYLDVARTISGPARGPEHALAERALCLGCRIEHAPELVYADVVNLGDTKAAVPVGPSCRLCQHSGCIQRVLPALQQSWHIDPDVRGPAFFTPPESIES